MNVIVNLKQTKELEKNDIILYQNGAWTNVRKDEFLMEHTKQLVKLNEGVKGIDHDLMFHLKEIESLKNRDLFIAKSIYDNYIERGLIDENPEFDQKFYDFIFNGHELKEEDFDNDFKNILEKVRS